MNILKIFPDDIIIEIFKHIGFKDVLNAMLAFSRNKLVPPYILLHLDINVKIEILNIYNIFTTVPLIQNYICNILDNINTNEFDKYILQNSHTNVNINIFVELCLTFKKYNKLKESTIKLENSKLKIISPIVIYISYGLIDYDVFDAIKSSSMFRYDYNSIKQFGLKSDLVVAQFIKELIMDKEIQTVLQINFDDIHIDIINNLKDCSKIYKNIELFKHIYKYFDNHLSIIHSISLEILDFLLTEAINQGYSIINNLVIENLEIENLEIENNKYVFKMSVFLQDLCKELHEITLSKIKIVYKHYPNIINHRLIHKRISTVGISTPEELMFAIEKNIFLSNTYNVIYKNLKPKYTNL